MANPVIPGSATVETPVETMVPIAENCQLVPTDMNRLAASYPRGMPQNFAAHFANGGAFLPHPTLTTTTAAGIPTFPWGIPTVQTPPVDASNPEDNQGQVPHENPDAEGEYRGPRLHFQIPTQVAQAASAHQAAPFSYPGATSMPMMTYAPANPAL